MYKLMDKFVFNGLWKFSYIVLTIERNLHLSLQSSACENKVTWRNNVENSSTELKKPAKTYQRKINLKR